MDGLTYDDTSMTDSNSQNNEENNNLNSMNGLVQTANHLENDGGLRPADGLGKTVDHIGDDMVGNEENLRPGDDKTVKPLGYKRPNGRWKADDLILERYRVLDELGQGGMGVVYHCRDTVGNVDVAVKALPPEVSHNPAEMKDMWENYGLVSGLIHENIAVCRTLEKDNQTDDYYLVMEYVEGQDLRSWIKEKRRNGSLTFNTALPVLRQIATALDAAHKNRIMHRDVKPDNVRIKPNGAVKVLDFGLAAQIRSSLSHVSREYSPRAGTNLYKAPEQWRGQPQGEATDQYALAVTAYEMLAGHVPFEDNDVDVLKKAVLEDDVMPIVGLPPYANEALQVGLAKEPSERYKSCLDFVRALGGEKVERKTENVFDENKFYVLWGQVEEYREKYEKTDWDRGQTFGAHLESFMRTWRAADAASRYQNRPKAYEFLLKTEAEWEWLQRNIPLREEAAKKRGSVQEQQKRAEDNQAQKYAKEEWCEALHCQEEASNKFEAGEFEAAMESFASAYALFEKAGKDALTEHLRQLEDAFTETIAQNDFNACGKVVEEISRLNAVRAKNLAVTMQTAKAKAIVELKEAIEKSAYEQGDLAKAYEYIKTLTKIDPETGHTYKKDIDKAKAEGCRKLEEDISKLLEEKRYREAEDAVQALMVAEWENAESIEETVRNAKNDYINLKGNSILLDLDEGRYETAHDKVLELKDIDEAEWKKWGDIIRVHELEQEIADAVARKRFAEADRDVQELSALNAEKGRRKQETVENAKADRIRQLELVIAADIEQGVYKTAYDSARELATINEEKGNKWVANIRIHELEQIIQDDIARRQYGEADEAIQEMASLNEEKGREWGETVQKAKEERISQLEAQISKDIENMCFKSAYDTVHELANLSEGEGAAWERRIHVNELVQAIFEAITKKQFADADTLIHELEPLDAEVAKEQTEKVLEAKKKRIDELEQIVQETINSRRFRDCNGSIEEIRLLAPEKAVELEQSVRESKDKVIAELETDISAKIANREFSEAHAVACELIAIDIEKGKQQEKNIHACELTKAIEEHIARREIVAADKLFIELSQLDAEKAKEWEMPVLDAKKKRVQELSISILQEVADGKISDFADSLGELSALDAAEAKKCEDAIKSKKDSHIALLVQRIEDMMADKRFDDAAKSVVELTSLDAEKAKEYGKKVEDLRNHNIIQLETMISEFLMHWRFDEAEEELHRLAAISDSSAKAYEERIQIRKLELSFQNALEEKRFTEAKNIIQTVKLKDSVKAGELDETLKKTTSEQSRQLKKQIKEAMGDGNFDKAFELVHALALVDSAEGRDFEGKVQNKRNAYIHKLEKAFKKALEQKHLPEAREIAEEMEAINSEKAQKWKQEIEKGGSIEKPVLSPKRRMWLWPSVAAVVVLLLLGVGILGWYIHVKQEVNSLAESLHSYYEHDYNEYWAPGQTVEVHKAKFEYSYHQGLEWKNKRLGLARKHFLMAYKERVWFVKNIPLREKAAEARRNAMDEKHKAESRLRGGGFPMAENIYKKADQLFESADFNQAIITFDEAAKMFIISSKIAISKRVNKLETDISEFIDNSRFADAEAQLLELEGLGVEYSGKAKELREKLEDARKRQKVIDALAYARIAITNRNWQWALNKADEVLSMDSDNAEAKEIKVEALEQYALMKIQATAFTEAENLIAKMDKLDYMKALTLRNQLADVRKRISVSDSLASARSALNNKSWEWAQQKADDVLRQDANNAEAKRIKADALAGRISLNISVLNFTQTDNLIAELEQLDFQQARNLKEKIENLQRKNRLLVDAKTAIRNKNWPEAQNKADELLLLDADNTDDVGRILQEPYENSNEILVSNAGKEKEIGRNTVALELQPSVRIIATVGGKDKMAILEMNGEKYVTPFMRPNLTRGQVLRGRLTFSEHNEEYEGMVDMEVNWHGMTEITVELKKTEPRTVTAVNTTITETIDNGIEYKIVTLPGGVELKLVKVTAGSFNMGPPYGAHMVTLTKDYWLGQYEVTQKQYASIMEKMRNETGEECKPRPSGFKGDDRLPVECVSWYDARAFCKKLNELLSGKLLDGYRFDLPTEAQWEFAARGGSKSKGYEYSGSNILGDVGWVYDTSDGKTHPVGKKEKNELELYDMSGNVWEWCMDSCERDEKKRVVTDTYKAGIVDPLCSRGSNRVYRGGGWNEGRWCCRSWARYCSVPIERHNNNGFRVALVPVDSSASSLLQEANHGPIVSGISTNIIEPASRNDIKAISTSENVATWSSRDIKLKFKGVTMTLKPVPSGSFMNKDNKKMLTLRHGYWLGETEVTQAQWKAVGTFRAKDNRFRGNNFPVETVSWDEARRFCDDLNRLCKDQLPSGYKLDLPTAAQWEHAARGGKNETYEYSGGNDLDKLGWYFGNSVEKHLDNVGLDDDKMLINECSTHPVGEKMKNSLGLRDMSGNVYEWCRDGFDKNCEYDPETLAGLNAMGGKHVIQGGAWCFPAESCQLSWRVTESGCEKYIGFRVALVPVQ